MIDANMQIAYQANDTLNVGLKPNQAQVENYTRTWYTKPGSTFFLSRIRTGTFNTLKSTDIVPKTVHLGLPKPQIEY